MAGIALLVLTCAVGANPADSNSLGHLTDTTTLLAQASVLNPNAAWSDVADALAAPASAYPQGNYTGSYPELRMAQQLELPPPPQQQQRSTVFGPSTTQYQYSQPQQSAAGQPSNPDRSGSVFEMMRNRGNQPVAQQSPPTQYTQPQTQFTQAQGSGWTSQQNRPPSAAANSVSDYPLQSSVLGQIANGTSAASTTQTQLNQGAQQYPAQAAQQNRDVIYERDFSQQPSFGAPPQQQQRPIDLTDYDRRPDDRQRTYIQPPPRETYPEQRTASDGGFASRPPAFGSSEGNPTFPARNTQTPTDSPLREAARVNTDAPTTSDTRATGNEVAQTPTTPEKPRAWWPLLLTVLGLFGSLGFNVYLGWIAWDLHGRYREVVDDLHDLESQLEEQSRDTYEPSSHRRSRTAALAG